MKTLKFVLFFVLLVSMLVTACGGGAPATTAPEQTEAPAAGEGEKVKLVFWSMWNEPEPQAQVIAAWIADFEAANPNIDIEAVWNGRENQTKARTALASGTVIDIVDQDSDQIAGGMMSEGLGYPLDEFLNQTALDENIPIKDVFTPGVLDTFKYEGHNYLWHYISNPVMWWYNKDIFEKAGITELPTTWTGFLEASQKIKDAGYNAIATEGDVFDYNMFIFDYLVQRQKGNGFLLSVIEDKTGEMWKDPVILNTINMMRELWDKGYIPPEAEGFVWPAGQTTLATGETAMELCGGWLPTELREIAGPDFKWGGMRFPEVEGGVGKIDELHSWLLAFMILKDSQHPQEAFEFLKFIMTAENQKKMADQALVGVTRKGVTWAPAIADGEAAAANSTAPVLYIDGAYAFHAEYVTNVLNKPFLDVFYGRITPEEFVQNMVDTSKTYWETHTK